MATPAHPRRFYQFGPFRLDAASRVLLRGGEAVPLSPVVVETLRFLVENRGDVVSKEELLRAVWPDTFVEESNLTHNISVLRKALGESPGEQRFIQTIPKRGYRFVAAVSEVAELPSPGSLAAEDAAPSRLAPQRQPPASPSWVRCSAWALGLGVLAALTVAAYLWLRPANKPAAANATFTQLTDQSGQELYPSLSPDGNVFAYAGRAAGNWDIYLQRVGGKVPINLTSDSAFDDTQPSFSPDGLHIAFRSERDGGGVFIMGATGESVRRATDFGYNPAWSPDGRRIVCATVTFQNPGYRPYLGSRLYVVDVLTGEKRLLAGLDDAVQPHWSPGGRRIAYWGSRGGSRDIWTVSTDSSSPIQVTRDTALDWNPVWAPDGKHLYFSSNRSGSMNLWRVTLDGTSGKVLGPLEPVTTPSPFSGYVSFSSDGRRLACVQQVRTVNIERIAFDPGTEKAVGTPVAVTRGLRSLWSPAPSSNGEWIAFGEASPRGHILVMQADGTGMRQLTDHSHNNRLPVWSPDDKRIAFCSTRSGKWEIWVINADGSGLQQLSQTPEAPVVGPVWSPDGARLACSRLNGDPLIINAGQGWNDQRPEALPSLGEQDVFFAPRSWSSDGKMLAGDLRRARGVSSGIAIYSFADKNYRKISEFGAWPRWLHDNRRLMFHHQSNIYLTDMHSGRVRKIYSDAPREIEPNGGLGVTSDDRQIYFSSTVAEADIWMMTIE